MAAAGAPAIYIYLLKLILLKNLYIKFVCFHHEGDLNTHVHVLLDQRIMPGTFWEEGGGGCLFAHKKSGGNLRTKKAKIVCCCVFFSLDISIVHSYNLNEYKRSCTESYGGNQRIKLVVVIKLYYIFI